MKLVLILFQIFVVAMVDHAKELLLPIVLILPFYLVAIAYVMKSLKEDKECEKYD